MRCGKTVLHTDANVEVGPGGMTVHAAGATFFYTDVESHGSLRFRVTSQEGQRFMISIGKAGGCGCG